ncbi:MAG: orotate phosphoribosyltransferase, partial [Wenzhouxiangella sp.]|nr:orotate phosphoribosyltransferase [Wenzhouxiangella sp.]
TSIRHSRNLIDQGGAEACAVAIALDRQERGRDDRTAVAEVREQGIDVVAVATLDDLIAWLDRRGADEVDRSAMLEYRRKYGVEA